MEKHFHKPSSWVWRNRNKLILLGFLAPMAYLIIASYITLPWKIDFFINWQEYRFIAESMVFIYPEIRIISPKEIVFFESNIIEWRVVRVECRNKNIKASLISEPDAPVCDEKYNWLFRSIGNTDIHHIAVFDIDDSKGLQNWSKIRPNAQIQILTNSFFSRILDTSYIYSKGFFKSKNPWRNFSQILNEDWWVYQDLN